MKNREHKHKDFLKALLIGNRAQCSDIVRNDLDYADIKPLYEGLLKKSLYEIGELWEYNKISVATEHLASAMVEAILNEVYSGLKIPENHHSSVVVACVENEHHQIGIRMVRDVFELNGWNTYFLGSDTPAKEFLDFVGMIKPEVVALSLSLFFNIPELEKLLRKIRSSFPDVQVIVGGQAFHRGRADVLTKYPGVKYIPDLIKLESYIQSKPS